MNKLSSKRWKCGILHLWKPVARMIFLPCQHHASGNYANLTFFIDSKFYYPSLYYILDIGGGQIYWSMYLTTCLPTCLPTCTRARTHTQTQTHNTFCCIKNKKTLKGKSHLCFSCGSFTSPCMKRSWTMLSGENSVLQ